MPEDDRKHVATVHDYTVTSNTTAMTVTLPHGGGRTIYWKDGMVQSEHRLTADTAAASPTIYHHGECSYSEDGKVPVLVPPEWDGVLRAFLDRDVALSTKDLSKVTGTPSRVVGLIAERFKGGAVRRPARKGDGYFVRVRSLPKKEATG
jgi:hypothetical protein